MAGDARFHLHGRSCGAGFSQGKDAAGAPFLAISRRQTDGPGFGLRLSNCAIISRVLSPMSFYRFKVAGFEPVMVERDPDESSGPLASIDRSDAVHGTRAANLFDAASAASATMELFLKLKSDHISVPAGRAPQAGRLNHYEPKRKAPENRSPGLWTFHNRMNRLPRRARAGGALMKATNIPRGRAHDRHFPGYKRARDRWPPFGFAIRIQVVP
jgi:hypothetical protein